MIQQPDPKKNVRKRFVNSFVNTNRDKNDLIALILSHLNELIVQTSFIFLNKPSIKVVLLFSKKNWVGTHKLLTITCV